MQPESKGRSDGSTDTDVFEPWAALQASTDSTRANILADIVGHPTMPTVEELDYTNPSLSDDSIRRHLSRLQDAGVVVKHELEPGDRHKQFPYQFYAVSSDARALFDQNNLFPVDAWQRTYATVEKTDRINDVEQMPRPDA
jgi:DNA-binding transcriptional ArsR family regulator